MLIIMYWQKMYFAIKLCSQGFFLYSEDTRPVSLQKQEPILLWWYEDGMPHDTSIKKSHRIECSSGRACIASCDRSLKNGPGSVAYIFYGTSFSANDLPLPRNPDDVWALLHEESPKNNWLFSHEDGIRYRMVSYNYDNLLLYHCVNSSYDELRTHYGVGR